MTTQREGGGHARAEDAAMTDATPVRGTIRPLVWDRGSAVTSFGRYTVVEEDLDNDPFWFVLIDGRSLGRLGEHESEDSAKAAAQADYEARILAAIQPAPTEASAAEAARVLLDQPYEAMYAAFTAMDRLQGEGADNIMAAALRALVEAGQ